MAEAAFITPTAEMLAPTPATPVAPAPVAAGGIFAGMLAQRLQPLAESPLKGEGIATAKAEPLPGEGLPPAELPPQGGNPLPPADAPPLVADVDGGPPAVVLPLPPLAEPALAAGDGLPSPMAPVDAPVEDPATAAIQVDATALLPVAPVLPSSAPPPDIRPRPAVADGAVAHGRGAASQPAPVAPPLPGLAATQPALVTDPRQRPASLGLNTRGEAGGMPRGDIAGLSAEQLQRGATAAPITQQTLAGEALSRQFQQQIDRLLATGRGPVASGAPLVTAPDSTTTGTADPSPGGALVLPGIAGEARSVVATGPAGMPLPVVNTGVGHPGWSAELGQRMMWLARQEIREAQIQLNPRHLGPIDVRIVYSDAQQLSVSFNAQNPAAREALDAALPRLREMFEQQGLNLTDASVSQESFAGRQRDTEDGGGQPSRASAAASGPGDDELPRRPPPVVIGRGLLDTFA